MELLGKSILILPDENPEESTGGILIPKTVKKQPITGLVIDVGPEVQEVKKGDRVHYARKSSSRITLEEKKYHFATEDMIVYIH